MHWSEAKRKSLEIIKKMQKSIINDITKLTFLYGINSSFPLIISIFLINKIGLYQFGIYSISIYFSQTLLIIPEYGFSLGAAKTLGQLKNNLAKSLNFFGMFKLSDSFYY